MSEATTAAGPPGLRERKKARTRAVIREQALRLFRAHGYAATTVEQIAAAADVSPSTFFRYFPTKEDVVLQDEFDLIALAEYEAQPPGLSPVAAFRAASAAAFARLAAADLDRFRETTELAFSVPELRAKAIDELARTIDVIAAATARRTGRDASDFEVRNLAGAVIGVIMAATTPWGGERGGDMASQIDAALAHLEAGLPL